MGSGRWSSTDWAATSARMRTRSRSGIFSRRAINPDFDPAGIMVRESRDSDDNPSSTAIIIGLDVTGSMGMIPERLIKENLGPLVQEILDRKPVPDPHIMLMAIGDAPAYDSAPLQVTQFEADTRIVEQLAQLYLEGGGGGNGSESYHLPWLFAAQRTAIDCMEKRGRKGYLFTVGDENPPAVLRAEDVARVMGGGLEGDLPTRDILALAEQSYHVFHVMVEHGHHHRRSGDAVRRNWTDLLGERAIPLSDHTRLAEVIVSAIQINEGASPDAVAGTWSGETARVVTRAVTALTRVDAADNGIIRL